MITRLWPLTLLVTQLVLAYDHKIDLARCKDETACFIRESCLIDKSDPNAPDFSKWQANLIQFKDDVVKLKESDCDVVLQMKALSDKMFHVMMQIKANSNEKLKIDEGVKVDQGGTMFHCKPNQPVTGQAGMELKNEGSQKFDDSIIFCSITAKLSDATHYITNLNRGKYERPSMLASKDTGAMDLKFASPENAMWIQVENTKSACKAEEISSSNKAGTDPEMVLKEMNTFTKPPFTCPLGIWVDAGASSGKGVNLFCETAGGPPKWMKDDGIAPTSLTGPFSIYCLEKRCQQCKSAPPDVECDGCSKTPTVFTPPAAGDQDACPTLGCPNKKWTLTGKEIIDQGDQDKIECKQSKADASKYAWFLKEIELEKAACMEPIDCGKRFEETLKNQVPATCASGSGDKCTIVGLKTNEIKCKEDHHFKLTPAADVGDVLDCDPLTGRYRKKGATDGLNFTLIECVEKTKESGGKSADAQPATGGDGNTNLYIGIGLGVLAVIVAIGGIIFYCFFLKKRKKKADAAAKTQTASAKKTDKTDASTNKSTGSSVSSVAPDIVVDGSDGKKKSGSRKSKGSKRDSKKSKGSKKERKFCLEDYETWDNEKFNKKILPNFKYCEFESQTKWVRNCLGRFYAYCNTKKTKEDLGDIDISTISIAQTPESGTFQQFWLLVKQCADDKCVNAGVWTELFRIVFTMGYSIVEKNEHLDNMRILLIKPFETYMLEHLKKCDLFKQKDEPRHVTEMRVICISILIHTRHPEVTDNLRKLTFNEKLEVPLRMMTAACYTRERDEIGTGIQQQYIRVCEQGIVDPHSSEGWGTYLQHCIYGLGGFLITLKETYQTYLFDAIYQFPMQKSETEARRFSPTDWLYAYKGACLHENSAKIAMEMFEKMNGGCLLHIETLLKTKYEDPDERNRAREMYKRDMKEYTMLLSTLLIGEEEFNRFRPHLRFVILFVGDQAKIEEPLDEDRIRERAINLHNMIRDRNFAKETCDCLRNIGAKLTQ